MRQFLLLLGLVFVCGCGPSDNASIQKPNVTKAVVDSSPKTSAFRFDEQNLVIYLNTQIAPPQSQRFDIGQGSITLETLHVKDNKLTFQYTPEIEGGYTIYECTVPVSSAPLEFKITSDGIPGATSFSLENCKKIRSGNLHFE